MLHVQVTKLTKEKAALQKIVQERDPAQPDQVPQAPQAPQRPGKSPVPPLGQMTPKAVSNKTTPVPTITATVSQPKQLPTTVCPPQQLPIAVSLTQQLPPPAATNAPTAGIKLKLKIGPASKMGKKSRSNAEVVSLIVDPNPSATRLPNPSATATRLPSTNPVSPEVNPAQEVGPLFQEPSSSLASDIAVPKQEVALPNFGKIDHVVKSAHVRKRKKASSKRKAASKKKLRLEDVEWDDSQTECCICKSIFPPKIAANFVSDELYDYKVTDWVGCDCSNWFHQVNEIRANMQRF